MSNGVQVSIQTATASDARIQIVGYVSSIAFIVSAILFISWFYRAYSNLHVKVQSLEHKPGWAVGYWCIPILNFFRPYEIMKELYVETDSILLKHNLSLDKTASTKALGWWWTLWIVWNLYSRFVDKFAIKATTLDELTIASWASLISSMLMIPLALLAIKVIRDYSMMESALSEIPDYFEEN